MNFIKLKRGFDEFLVERLSSCTFWSAKPYLGVLKTAIAHHPSYEAARLVLAGMYGRR